MARPPPYGTCTINPGSKPFASYGVMVTTELTMAFGSKLHAQLSYLGLLRLKVDLCSKDVKRYLMSDSCLLLQIYLLDSFEG